MSFFNFIMKRNSIIFLFLSLLVFVLFALDLVSGIPALSVRAGFGTCSRVTDGYDNPQYRAVDSIGEGDRGCSDRRGAFDKRLADADGFPEPLADPYLLGSKFGSGLGVAFFILGAPLLGLAHSGFWQSVGIVGAGWGGAVMVLLLIAIISRYVKNILGVLIMGVMIGYIAGAIIQILQYLSSAEQLKMFFLWSMGSLGHVTTTKLFYHDSRDLRGRHSLDLLYQGIESSFTRGELCPNDGTEYTACQNAYFSCRQRC